MPDEATTTEVAAAPELSHTPAGDGATDPMPDLSGFEELGLGAALPGSAPAATDAGSPAPGSTTSKPSGAAGPTERPSINTKGPRAGAAEAAPAAARSSTSKPVVSQPGAPAPGRAAKLAEVAPHVRPLLERMSNDAFNHFYPLALKLQNGELVEKAVADKAVADKEAEMTAQLSKARYYDHERGYTLTEEYQTLTAQTSQMEQEAAFWADQIEAINAGQPWRVLVQDKEGNIRVSAERDPKEPGALARAQSMLTKAHTLHANLASKLEALPAAHKAEYGKYSGFFTDLDSQLFSKLTDPNSKSYNKSIVERAAAQLQQWPAMFRARPEVKALANALAVGEAMVARIQQLQSELGKVQNHNKALANGSPAPGSVEAGVGDAAQADEDAAISELDRLAGRF